MREYVLGNLGDAIQPDADEYEFLIEQYVTVRGVERGFEAVSLKNYSPRTQFQKNKKKEKCPTPDSSWTHEMNPR